jgi:hypothetical protein
MPKREKKADGDRSFAFLHQLTSYIVDRGNVISVHRMAKAKGISQKGGPEKKRLVVESNNGPNPGSDVYASQKSVKTDHSILETG